MDSFEDRLTSLAQVEARTIRAYQRSLPHIDTPEFAQKLALIEDRHRRRLEDVVHYLPNDPDSPEVGIPTKVQDTAKVATLGDTAETLSALIEIAESERQVCAAWKTALTWDDLPSAIRSQIEEDAQQENKDLKEIEQYLVSVRAAAKLLGPDGAQPFLHH